MDTANVTFNEKTYRVPVGTCVTEILGHAYIEEHSVIGALLNNHLVALSTTLHGDESLEAVTANDHEGQAILRRSASLMLHTITARKYPEWVFSIGQSLLGGYFYEIEAPEGVEIDLEELAKELTEELCNIAKSDVPFKEMRVPVETAHKLLTDVHNHKNLLLRTWPSATVPMVRINGFADIRHGPYAPSTRYIKDVKLVAYEPGLVLQFSPEKVRGVPNEGRRLYAGYSETRDWNRRVGVATVGDLNQAILDDRIHDVMRVAEGSVYIDQATRLVNAIEFYKLRNGEYEHMKTMEFYDYNQPVDAKMFMFKDVSDDAEHIDLMTVGLAQGNLSDEEIAVEVVRQFFEALIARNYNDASKLFPGVPADEIKEMFGEINIIRIVSMGKPILRSETNNLRVPYEVEVEMEGKKSLWKKQGPLVHHLAGQPNRWAIMGF